MPAVLSPGATSPGTPTVCTVSFVKKMKKNVVFPSIFTYFSSLVSFSSHLKRSLCACASLLCAALAFKASTVQRLSKRNTGVLSENVNHQDLKLFWWNSWDGLSSLSTRVGHTQSLPKHSETLHPQVFSGVNCWGLRSNRQKLQNKPQLERIKECLGWHMGTRGAFATSSNSLRVGIDSLAKLVSKRTPWPNCSNPLYESEDFVLEISI